MKHSYCPFCDDFLEFLPFGRNKRPNALCPKCGSLERHRDDLNFLIKNTQILNSTKKINILHTSPEKCFYNFFKNIPNVKYYSINIDKNDKFALIICNIQKLPFKNECFDIIYSCHVLEHVKNDLLALMEFYRVLKNSGFALINIPIKNNLTKTLEEPWINTPKLREKFYGQSDHLRLYGKDFVYKLKKVGFNFKKATITSYICFKR